MFFQSLHVTFVSVEISVDFFRLVHALQQDQVINVMYSFNILTIGLLEYFLVVTKQLKYWQQICT